MGLHRVGQAGPICHLLPNVPQHLGQEGSGRLPLQDFQAAQKRHAAVQQVSQLRKQGSQLATAHRAATEKPQRPRLTALRRPRDSDGKKPLLVEHVYHFALRARRQHSGTLLARRGTSDEGKLRHGLSDPGRGHPLCGNPGGIRTIPPDNIGRMPW